MTFVRSAVAVILVWAVIAGVLSAYIRWCFRFSPDRQHMWREAVRRAGIAPLMLFAVIASQLLVNRVDTPFDPKNFVLAFVMAWLVPPVIVLVKHVTVASRSASLDVVQASATDDRAVSRASELAVLVVAAVVSLGVWFILAIGGTPSGWVGAMGMMPPLATTVTLFLLTRRAERSISSHAARAHHLGLLWSIGIALVALQIAAVASTTGRMTLKIGIGAIGMLLMSAVLRAFLVRGSAPRR